MATKAKKKPAAEKAADDVPVMAPVLGGPVPYLVVDGAVKAAKFYERAFGAKLVGLQPPDEQGRTMHAHLHLDGGSLMLCDGFPEHGHPVTPHQGYALHLYIAGDIDARWEQAIAAGCEVTLPLQVMFWGDRYGQLKDPFGVNWSMGKPNEA